MRKKLVGLVIPMVAAACFMTLPTWAAPAPTYPACGGETCQYCKDTEVCAVYLIDSGGETTETCCSDGKQQIRKYVKKSCFTLPKKDANGKPVPGSEDCANIDNCIEKATIEGTSDLPCGGIV